MTALEEYSICHYCGRPIELIKGIPFCGCGKAADSVNHEDEWTDDEIDEGDLE